jgi:E3 ubiquitin-protein ligase RNF11
MTINFETQCRRLTHSTILQQSPKPESTQSGSHQSLPIYYPAPCSSSRLVSQLGEEEQIQIAKRIGLIQHLPCGTYDGGGSSKKSKECVICMVEFVIGDSIRFLPCMHTYHAKCIDDWLMRSFICPSCMEPVDAALLSTFQ